MKTLVLGFKAFDIHELLCHLVADRLGYYRDAGLQVSLRDVAFVPDDKLGPNTLLISCGSALLSRLRGFPFKVIFVATDRPLFWLYAPEGVTQLRQLEGKKVATFPPVAPPWHFLRLILRRRGLDPSRDLQLEVARDDAARLGLLKSGDVQAAVLSSTIAPPKVQRAGFSSLLFFGDELRVPTTGLAATDELIKTQPDLVRRAAGVLRRSLDAIHGSPTEVVPVIADLLGDSTARAEETYELLHPYFTQDGRTASEMAQGTIDSLREELGLDAPLRASDFYDFSFLEA
jgi:ABC-type nitrate/sulfonate/bicarbonate transport system substrate-binding protein